MVQIKIKGLSDGIHVFADFNEQQTFLYELEKRLKLLSCKEDLVEAFFHLSYTNEQLLMALFQLCSTYNIVIKGFDEVKTRQISMRQGTLHNGQQISLSEDTIWIGDLHSGSQLLCKGSLFVVGKVEGFIDLYYEDAILAASYLDASIRICDSRFHNLTSFSPVKVYYNKRTIEVENVKEELYGRGHCNYVW